MSDDAQTAALKWLAAHNGEGAIDRAGKLVAAGVTSTFDAATWLRLATKLLVVPAGPGRIRITDAGTAIAQRTRVAA